MNSVQSRVHYHETLYKVHLIKSQSTDFFSTGRVCVVLRCLLWLPSQSLRLQEHILTANWSHRDKTQEFMHTANDTMTWERCQPLTIEKQNR